MVGITATTEPLNGLPAPSTQGMASDESAFTRLAVGTRWLARIAQVLPDEVILLEIGDAVVRTRWDGPPPSTTEIEVEVLRRLPQLQLRLVGTEGTARRGMHPDPLLRAPTPSRSPT